MTDQEPKETGRVEAFSDGVFAIAITLLGLDLKVPHLQEPVSATVLIAWLGRQWPTYMAFLSSFVTILIMWMNHHRVFSAIGAVDGPLMFLNGALLLLVTAVPFATALLADYYLTPAASVGCAVYAGMFVLISMAFSMLWFWAARGRRLLRAHVTSQLADRIGVQLSLGLPFYVVATVVAFVNVHVSMAFVILLWVYWAIGRSGTK